MTPTDSVGLFVVVFKFLLWFTGATGALMLIVYIGEKIDEKKRS